MTERKVESLLSGEAKNFDELPTQVKALKDPILRCDQSTSNSAPAIAYVSKLISVDRSQISKLRHQKKFELSEEEIRIRRSQADLGPEQKKFQLGEEEIQIRDRIRRSQADFGQQKQVQC